jgi:hypothetical protein
MERQQDLLDSDHQPCDGCERKGGWCAPSAGPERAEIIVAIPAVTPETEAVGEVLHPASQDYAWIDFLFRHVGYPLSSARRTAIVRCASANKPSRESVTCCRQLLADEIRSTGAGSVVVVGDGPWSALVGHPNSETTWNVRDTINLGEDLEIPVFFVRGLHEALHIDSPSTPPAALVRDLELVADAVREANPEFSPKPTDARALFDDFLKKFIGYQKPRILSDTEGLNSKEKAAQRLQALGLHQNIHEEALAAIRQTFLTGSKGYRVRKFEAHKRPGKTPLFEGSWATAKKGYAYDNLLAMHFTGELTLGSYDVHEQSVLVLDIDKHNDLQRVHFEQTLIDVSRLFPQGLFVQSSSSGGMHVYLFLTETVPYKELVALARLFLQRKGLGIVPAGRLMYERVEVPHLGLRLPFGLGSYPVLPGFDESNPVPDMLGALFEHARQNPISPADLFLDERRDVEERLNGDDSKKRRWRKEESSPSKKRETVAKELLIEEKASQQTPISKTELDHRLRLDPHGALFARARDYIKRRYVVGIETYGTRFMVTPSLAVSLATVGGCDEAKAVEVLRYWVLNRPHVSRGIQSRLDEVLEGLPSVVEREFQYAREHGYAAGTVTTGDIRHLVDLLGEPARSDPSRLPPGFHRIPQSVRDPRTGRLRLKSTVVMHSDIRPQRLGTQTLHFLELGFELIRFLRGKGGRAPIAARLLKQWGHRDYARHVQSLERLQMISRTGQPSKANHMASIFELLWPEHPGAKVIDRFDGLAAVMTEEEIGRTFQGRPGTITDLLSRRQKLLTREDAKIAPVE